MARHYSWASGAHPLLLACALMAALAGSIVLADGIIFHVANKCPFPVWPASAPNTGHPVLADGGFFLPPGKTKRVAAPATWNGRFWARTGCNFTTGDGAYGNGKPKGAACLTGDCEGRLACNGSIGAPPATLIEVNLHADQSKGSSYDVSLVDGYNLPVAVSTKPANGTDHKCSIAGCAKDVNAVCPLELQVTATAGGGAKTKTVVACKSACLAFGLDAFCCRGAYATPAACRGSMYSRLFKDACPAYYSYAYDTTAATASGCYAQEYVITFCPSRWGEEPDRVAQI
ncbi:thaumatin-like protein [Phragmites australis]|uniref:thaumatin-like protein n=1 Tax=Phragmites australis TaxID=29695 RepID=UPI002D76E4C3|nr:thaumatin-like protein [Phragmites australis]